MHEAILMDEINKLKKEMMDRDFERRREINDLRHELNMSPGRMILSAFKDETFVIMMSMLISVTVLAGLYLKS